MGFRLKLKLTHYDEVHSRHNTYDFESVQHVLCCVLLKVPVQKWQPDSSLAMSGHEA